jgi:hypothetical protein
MAKKKNAKAAKKKTASRPRRAKEKVSKVIHQVKEPFSLLGTLREEGLSNAINFLTMAGAVAGEARKNLRLEAMRPQLKDLVSSLGFAFRSDLDRLEARLEELEQKLSEREYEALSRDDDLSDSEE